MAIQVVPKTLRNSTSKQRSMSAGSTAIPCCSRINNIRIEKMSWRLQSGLDQGTSAAFEEKRGFRGTMQAARKLVPAPEIDSRPLHISPGFEVVRPYAHNLRELGRVDGGCCSSIFNSKAMSPAGSPHHGWWFQVARNRLVEDCTYSVADVSTTR